MPEVGELFADLKRVEVIDSRKSGGWTNGELAGLALQEVKPKQEEELPGYCEH